MTKQLSQTPNRVAKSPAAGLNTTTGRVPVRASCLSAAGFGLVRQFGPRRQCPERRAPHQRLGFALNALRVPRVSREDPGHGTE